MPRLGLPDVICSHCKRSLFSKAPDTVIDGPDFYHRKCYVLATSPNQWIGGTDDD